MSFIYDNKLWFFSLFLPIYTYEVFQSKNIIFFPKRIKNASRVMDDPGS